MRREALLAVAVAAALLAPLPAQQGVPTGTQQQEPRQAPRFQFLYDSRSAKIADRDDYQELHAWGGFRVLAPGLGLELRGEKVLILLDLETVHRALAQGDDGPPRRELDLPSPRRRLSPDLIRARLERSAQAFGAGNAAPIGDLDDRDLEAIRYVYCENGVVVVRNGVQVLRCDRLWISPLDDRIVVENAELRYVTPGRADSTLVVRGPKLVKQGGRWTGRDVVVTSCTAAEPHAGIGIDDVEIVERGDEFEIIGRGQTLQLGGTAILPLPNASFFTKSQGEFPIRRARVAYSQKEGVRTELVLGLPWNATGGALHHALTGRPASEFRGDWELGLGWIEKRGEPLDAVVDYRAAGLYEGRTEAFWMDDRGDDRREISTFLDGTDVPDGNRGVLRTQNRVHLGPRTHVDLVAFHASDPAVWSEYFNGAYRSQETPETSVYLHHAAGNRLLTVGTRQNLSEFSYRDDRALATRFIEEEPVVTWQWLAEPIGETPWRTPIVVDLGTEIGQRRSDFDDRAGTRTSDRTLRADQLAELSMPFHLAGLSFRPFFAGRGTWFDEAVDGDSEGRVALTGGVQAGTRWSRTWSWLDDGEPGGVRHVIAPKISYLDRFRVDDRPGEFQQFDGLDNLGEQSLVRVEVRNLIQSMAQTEGGRQPRDFLFLDLAQDLYPDAGRDNGGETLGLLYYDLLLRPRVRWWSLDTFAFAIYGDHDWQSGLRTFDTELQLGPIAGLNWAIDYRRDRAVDGAVGLTVSTRLLDRWEVFAYSQRDIDRDVWLSYVGGLRRVDHDWSIQAIVVYDTYTDDKTFRIDFLPRLGSFTSPRGSRFAAFDGPDQMATSF
ncbi:MAG: hypothetical protein WAT39_10340 [Planctomycetota bacterium]